MACRSTPLVPSTDAQRQTQALPAPALARCAARYTRRRLSARASLRRNRSISTPQRSQRVFHRYAVAIGAHAVSLHRRALPANADDPSRAAAKSRAFFVRPIHQANRHRRLAVIFRVDAPQNLQPRHHIQAPSSQPPFGTESRCPPISSAFGDSPLQRHPIVPRRVLMMLDRQWRNFVREPFARFQPGLASRRRVARRCRRRSARAIPSVRQPFASDRVAPQAPWAA